MFAIDWLDLHSASVQAIATIALVGVTIVYVVFNKRMLDEMRKQTGPYIVLDFAITAQYDPSLLVLVVANRGFRNASKVTFRVLEETGSLSDATDALVQLRGHPLFQRELGTLPGQQEMVIPTAIPWRVIFGNIPGGSQQQRSWTLYYEVNYLDGKRLIKDKGEIGYTYLLGRGTRFVGPADYRGKVSLT